MASEKNLNAVFTDIANAIREKKGTTEQFQPINMAEEIVNLPSGSGKTVELSVTQNGTYVPDEGTAYSKVSVSVQQTAESGTLKAFLDATKSCYYLFYKYSGTSVEGLISYSDTSNVTNMSSMFNESKITTIPKLDTSSVTRMSYMFYSCSSLTTIPQLDTSKVTDMYGMFYNCQRLEYIPHLDTSNVKGMHYMFRYCALIKTIPQFDTSNVTDIGSMFERCYALTTIPKLNISKVTSMNYVFEYCSSLTTIPELDVSNVTSMSGVFSGCTSLKSILMTGMKVNFDISASTQFEESDLVTILNNLATVTSTQTLTMGSTNLAKLTDEEKAIATNKGWTLA